MARKKKESGFVLTPKNYFSRDRPHLSQSQLNDYLKSKEYFFRKHRLHEIEDESTPSMKLGSCVDAILSNEASPFCVRVLKRDAPDLYEAQKELPDDLFVSASTIAEAGAMAGAITKQEFWKSYSPDKRTQVILEGRISATPVCGKLDILDRVGDTFFIDDVKTASAGKTNKSETWTRVCYEYGYFRQLAFYRHLVRQNYGEDKKIQCRHVVVSKQATGLYQVKLFTFSDQILDSALNELVEAVLGIEEKNFTDEKLTWNHATHIQLFTEEEESFDSELWDEKKPE